MSGDACPHCGANQDVFPADPHKPDCPVSEREDWACGCGWQASSAFDYCGHCGKAAPWMSECEQPKKCEVCGYWKNADGTGCGCEQPKSDTLQRLWDALVNEKGLFRKYPRHKDFAYAYAEACDLFTQLEQTNREWRASFDLYYDACQRGTKMWREGHPERDLVVPDTAELVEWLLERMAELERETR